MEDYMDDLLENSLTRKDHLNVLDKIFKRLAEYKVHLNPNKCIFGVALGIFLGYIVSHRGIKVDRTTKVKEILDMAPLKGISELSILHGRLQSICCFII